MSSFNKCLFIFTAHQLLTHISECCYHIVMYCIIFPMLNCSFSLSFYPTENKATMVSMAMECVSHQGYQLSVAQLPSHGLILITSARHIP